MSNHIIEQIAEGNEKQVIERSSYRDILKSSAIIGGSTIFSIVMRILRMKVLAVILGPSGIGLVGIYTSILQLAETVAILGIETSGVRSIAEARGRDDSQSLARAVHILRRGTLLLGLFSAITFLALASSISQFTFGNDGHREALGILSITILLGSVCAGQKALVQGMRRIADLATMNMVGAVSGTVLGVLFIYVWGEEGIIPFMVAVSGMATATAWWFARKVVVCRVEMRLAEFIQGMKPLLNLGLVFMSSALMSACVAYMSRVMVVRYFGMEGAGLYQAAWALSTLYVGFVLQAMGADFYPRLMAAKEFTESNRLVNEQVEVGLLIASPGVLATLTYSPFVIQLFYSTEFAQAVEILRWQILGVLLQVAAWPLGYILVAQGRSQIFFWSELVAHGLHFLMIWIGILLWGLAGAGVAFFLLYVFYLPFIASIVRRRTGFKWSSANTQLGLIVLSVASVVFISHWVVSSMTAMVIGTVATIGLGVYSLMVARTLAGWPKTLKWSRS